MVDAMSLLLRHHHRVDDMDHAVGGGDVGGRDSGAIDADLAVLDRDLHGLTLNGLGLCELDDIGRLHRTRYHVIGQDVRELGLVLRLKQVLDRAGRKLGEGGIRRREHGERALALQRFDETGGRERCFQVYPFKDRGLVREFIGRARAAGYTSLCVTVDVPVFGNRERDRRAGLTLPPRVTVRRLREALARPGWTWRYVRSAPLELANVRHVAPAGHGGLATLADYVNAQFFPAVRWSDIEWMIDQWSGPFAVKGLLHPVDIRQAAALGATAVVLSNHGVDNSTARSRRFRCSRRLNAGFSSPSRSSSTAARGGVPTS